MKRGGGDILVFVELSRMTLHNSIDKDTAILETNKLRERGRRGEEGGGGGRRRGEEGEGGGRRGEEGEGGGRRGRRGRREEKGERRKERREGGEEGGGEEEGGGRGGRRVGDRYIQNPINWLTIAVQYSSLNIDEEAWTVTWENLWFHAFLLHERKNCHIKKSGGRGGVHHSSSPSSNPCTTSCRTAS